MVYTVTRSTDVPDDSEWVVDSSGDGGEMCRSVFGGYGAKERAHEYVELKSSGVDVPASRLRWLVAKTRGDSGEWFVEAIGDDGEVYRVVFSGVDAYKCALEYAVLKNGLFFSR